PPEAFRQPDASHQPDPYSLPDTYRPPDAHHHQAHAFQPDAGATVEPLSVPEPLVSAEPFQAMAGGIAAATPEARLGIESGGTMRLDRVVEEIVAWLKTLASAAVYATLIVTFGFQVARVEGQSMAPTLADQDRLIVNKLAYRIGEPQVGDIV